MLGICQLVGWWQMILCWFSTPALWFLLTLCLPPSILMMTGHHPMGEVRPHPPVCILYELWVEKPQNRSTNYLLCVVQLLLHHRQNHQCTPCHLLGWVRQEEALWWMDLSWIAGWAQGLLLHEVRLRLVDPILVHAGYCSPNLLSVQSWHTILRARLPTKGKSKCDECKLVICYDTFCCCITM